MAGRHAKVHDASVTAAFCPPDSDSGLPPQAERGAEGLAAVRDRCDWASVADIVAALAVVAETYSDHEPVRQAVIREGAAWVLLSVQGFLPHMPLGAICCEIDIAKAVARSGRRNTAGRGPA